ncbi:MAG TPA: hypothetical protein DD706_14215 [Nitrospiraceae bacterium]|nr:hypothetical protein [Nitrospiraceae bacterium]
MLFVVPPLQIDGLPFIVGSSEYVPGTGVPLLNFPHKNSFSVASFLISGEIQPKKTDAPPHRGSVVITRQSCTRLKSGQSVSTKNMDIGLCAEP